MRPFRSGSEFSVCPDLYLIALNITAGRYDKTTAFPLPREWLEELRQAARAERMSMSQILRDALRARLDRAGVDRIGHDLETEEARRAPRQASDHNKSPTSRGSVRADGR
jgi:hypothetical protein